MSENSPVATAADRALETFRRTGGTLRTAEALARNIHPRTLYGLRDSGVLERVSRGVYRLAELPPLGNPDLVWVAKRVPRAVVCLISALDHHGLTTEIPREVQIALPRGTKTPRIEYPPIRVFRFSPPAFRDGVEVETLDGQDVRIFSPAKSIADAFKFRNQLGVEVAVEALKTGLEERTARPAELVRFARICRVENVMRPYLEALI